MEEIEEVAVGETKDLTVSLAEIGDYVLICNMVEDGESHYQEGMQRPSTSSSLPAACGSCWSGSARWARRSPGWRRSATGASRWCSPTTTGPRAPALPARARRRDRASRWQRIDAGDSAAVAELARRHGVDLVMNAVDPRFVMPIFDGALAAGATTWTWPISLSRPHPDDPFRLPGVKLGDEQFARAGEWEAAGPAGACRHGHGSRPDRRLRRATPPKHLFDEVDEVHIRDGGDLEIPGYAFAPVFSIWTTIEECLNPPIIWERRRLAHHRAVLGARGVPVPGGHRPGRVRQRRARGGAARPALARRRASGDLQVRPRRRLHRQAQDAPRARAGPHRAGDASRACEVAPRDVRGGGRARPGHPGRQDASGAPSWAPG